MKYKNGRDAKLGDPVVGKALGGGAVCGTLAYLETGTIYNGMVLRSIVTPIGNISGDVFILPTADGSPAHAAYHQTLCVLVEELLHVDDAVEILLASAKLEDSPSNPR